MAFVVNVMLNLNSEEFWCDKIEDVLETCEALENINAWIADGELVSLIPPTFAKGAGYGMHAWLFGGGFKQFDIEGFIDTIEQQTWKEPDDVQLFMKVEEENSFSLMELNLKSK